MASGVLAELSVLMTVRLDLIYVVFIGIVAETVIGRTIAVVLLDMCVAVFMVSFVVSVLEGPRIMVVGWISGADRSVGV